MGACLDFRQNFWFDPSIRQFHGEGRLFDNDEKNGNGYGHTDQRINDPEIRTTPRLREQHRQAGEAIHAGMSIRDEGGRPDLLTHLMRKMAIASLPTNPMTAAAATHQRCCIG